MLFKNKLKIILPLLLALLVLPTFLSAQENLNWIILRPGFEQSTYYFETGSTVIKSEVSLFKIDPTLYSFNLVLANELGSQFTADIKSMTQHLDGLLGINTCFFEPTGKPLGLLVKNKILIQKVHSGGRTLSSIFYLKENSAAIVHRSQQLPEGVDIAVQSGPRLIANSAPIELETSGTATRRSGLAITNDNKIIIYATQLRFPGATLKQIQEMLMDKRLNIKDAINFDGGGSSQLYLAKRTNPSKGEMLLSGGDQIPVGLIIKEK